MYDGDKKVSCLTDFIKFCYDKNHDLLERGEVYNLTLTQGSTVLLPGGWIHCVFTPEGKGQSKVLFGFQTHYDKMSFKIPLFSAAIVYIVLASKYKLPFTRSRGVQKKTMRNMFWEG